nr:hypothetical protein Itr_chr07CG09850 [Ipomoea trifida]
MPPNYTTAKLCSLLSILEVNASVMVKPLDNGPETATQPSTPRGSSHFCRSGRWNASPFAVGVRYIVVGLHRRSFVSLLSILQSRHRK